MRLLVFLAVSNLITLVAAQKYTDENRPYKFGFNIEGHQHRKEEKDEKGIIRGEYGFITADGYYRVTVYETDEEGRFKIVSQKNYYVGFPPGDPTTTPNPKEISTTTERIRPHPPKISSRPESTATKRPIGKEGASCGSCLLPTEPAHTSQPINEISTTTEQISTPLRDILVKLAPSYVNEPDQPTKKALGLSPPNFNEIPGNGDLITTQRPLKSQSLSNIQDIATSARKTQPPPKRNELNPPPTRKESKPEVITITNNPGQENNLLYRFNYTVGFHGHNENGYRNGDKSGNYFTNGRDGVSRRVDYIANEFGYQPNITLTKIENNINRPHEDTEKSFGLKGYEFKWFYRK